MAIKKGDRLRLRGTIVTCFAEEDEKDGLVAVEGRGHVWKYPASGFVADPVADPPAPAEGEA